MDEDTRHSAAPSGWSATPDRSGSHVAGSRSRVAGWLALGLLLLLVPFMGSTTGIGVLVLGGTLWLIVAPVRPVRGQRITRVQALVLVGVALVSAGASVVFTLWSSSFSRYMHFEDLMIAGDLPLDDDTIGLVSRLTPADRQLAFVALAMVLLGGLAFVSAMVRSLRD